MTDYLYWAEHFFEFTISGGWIDKPYYNASKDYKECKFYYSSQLMWHSLILAAEAGEI